MSNLRVSRSKIQTLRKEEIAILLAHLNLDTTGLKNVLETRLYNALETRPELGTRPEFQYVFMNARGSSSYAFSPDSKSSNSRRSSKSPEETLSTATSSSPSFHLASTKPAAVIPASAKKYSPEKHSQDFGFSAVNIKPETPEEKHASPEEREDDVLVKEDEDEDGEQADEDEEEEDGEEEGGEDEGEDEEEVYNGNESTFVDETIAKAKNQFQNVDHAVRHWAKKLYKLGKKYTQEVVSFISEYLTLLWNNLLSWVWTTRSHLSKISVINGLFLLVEFSGLLATLVTQIVEDKPFVLPVKEKAVSFSREYASQSEIFGDVATAVASVTGTTTPNLEEIEEALGVIEQSEDKAVALVGPAITEVVGKAKATASYISDVFIFSDLWKPLAVWAVFLVLIPLAISFFFNLTSTYYTRKDQELKIQYELQEAEKQSVSKRTRSHARSKDSTGTSTNSASNTLIDISDETEDGPSTKKEININTPFIVDPLVFSLARFALVYFVYATVIPAVFSATAPGVDFFTCVVNSSKTVKFVLGNIPYFNSAFSVILSLYVASI